MIQIHKAKKVDIDFIEKIYKDIHDADINPLCDTLCMFVKNTPEGKNFINEIKIPTFP